LVLAAIYTGYARRDEWQIDLATLRMEHVVEWSWFGIRSRPKVVESHDTLLSWQLSDMGARTGAEGKAMWLRRWSTFELSRRRRATFQGHSIQGSRMRDMAMDMDLYNALNSGGEACLPELRRGIEEGMDYESPWELREVERNVRRAGSAAGRDGG